MFQFRSTIPQNRSDRYPFYTSPDFPPTYYLPWIFQNCGSHFKRSSKTPKSHLRILHPPQIPAFVDLFHKPRAHVLHAFLALRQLSSQFFHLLISFLHRRLQLPDGLVVFF